MDVPYNKDITYIAKTHFRNEEKVFGIKKKDRRQHMYVLGKSGTGKSVLLQNMIIQNIANGEGVCVVDPHGELVEDILRSIPEDRIKDVIYFNPADTEYHVGFNVLEVEDPKYKHLVASGLMGIFTKIWANTWSARMEYIMNNAILALLDTPGTTLLGIQRILVDKDYRQQIIGNLKDPVVKTFWIHEYEAWQDKFRNEAIAPIQNKVGQFLSTSIIRNVVGQSQSTINIFEIMNTGKIFLVNVSKGRVGEDNSALLGGMLITKIQLAAMERVRIPELERKDFYLYVDEFQNFVTDSFASILSEARKYRLNLIIAHQYTAQLSIDGSSAVRDAVFGNVGTMIIFRVGADDADFLEKEFAPEFLPEDILAQPNYHIYLKLMVDGVTSRPFSAYTLPPMLINAADDSKQKVIENSRAMYTKKKEVIEKEINEWSGMMGAREAKAPEGKWKATCSTCGKEVAVPFEPQEGRPVYCKDCMQKIKDGTLTPVKNFKVNPRKQVEANDALAALGIEFQAQAGQATERMERPSSAPSPVSSSGPTPKRSEAPQKVFTPRPAPPQSQAKPQQSTVPGTAATVARPPMHSVPKDYDKKPGEKFVHGPRKSPDKEDLGKILADALKDAGKTFSKNDGDQAVGVEKSLATPVVPVVPPAVSLSSLKSQSAPSVSTFSKKEQSEENKDELRKVLAGLMSKKTEHTDDHNHRDADIQEPAIAKVIDTEDRAFREAQADTVEEVKEIIDREQERQEQERQENLLREKEQAEKALREQEAREEEERERKQKEQTLREEKERQEKLEQEIRERRERIERERKELEEKMARDKAEREKQLAIARAEEEKKREIARQKEEAEAKRIREELQAETAKKDAAEQKKVAEERAQQEADKEAEAWLRNQRERRVYTDREGKVVPPVSGGVEAEEDVAEHEAPEQPAQQRTTASQPSSPTKKKKEVPEDLLRQILG
jgi:CxxC-x17-CxxC domain-containing protein